MIFAIIAILFLALVSALGFMILRAGKNAARLSAEKENDQAVIKANCVRDRLRSDPGFARRMRKRFTR